MPNNSAVPNKVESVGLLPLSDLPLSPARDVQDNNGVVRTHGECGDKKYSHRDLIEMIDGVDMKAGTVVAGNRGYYLKGPAVMLEFALQQFGMQMLVKCVQTSWPCQLFPRPGGICLNVQPVGSVSSLGSPCPF
jgi:seryl-tRNA synthetase